MEERRAIPAPIWRAKKWNVFQWIQLFSIVTALFHLCQGMAILVLGQDKTVPTHIDLQLWPMRGSNSTLNHFSALQKNTGNVSLAGMIAGFFFLSFFFQFVAVTFFWNIYASLLRYRCIQPFRWIEYSISASLMTLIFALLIGIKETSSLWTLFMSMTAVMLLGLLQEYQLTFKRSFPQLTKLEYFLPHFIGWIAFFSPITVFITKFSLSISNGPSKPPGWVYGIYASQFVVFGSFGLNQMVQQVRLYRNYKNDSQCAKITVRHEAVYVVLSLTAKSILAWVLYFNLLAESSISY
jgi:hypothetical protein